MADIYASYVFVVVLIQCYWRLVRICPSDGGTPAVSVRSPWPFIEGLFVDCSWVETRLEEMGRLDLDKDRYTFRPNGRGGSGRLIPACFNKQPCLLRRSSPRHHPNTNDISFSFLLILSHDIVRQVPAALSFPFDIQ